MQRTGGQDLIVFNKKSLLVESGMGEEKKNITCFEKVKKDSFQQEVTLGTKVAWVKKKKHYLLRESQEISGLPTKKRRD